MYPFNRIITYTSCLFIFGVSFSEIIDKKRQLLDKMGQEFKAELIKIDTAPKY